MCLSLRLRREPEELPLAANWAQMITMLAVHVINRKRICIAEETFATTWQPEKTVLKLVEGSNPNC